MQLSVVAVVSLPAVLCKCCCKSSRTRNDTVNVHKIGSVCGELHVTNIFTGSPAFQYSGKKVGSFAVLTYTPGFVISSSFIKLIAGTTFQSMPLYNLHASVYPDQASGLHLASEP